MWYKIRSVILFYFKAKTKFNIQSKFLFDFVNSVLDHSKEYYCFYDIEQQRKRVKSSHEVIEIQDFGAGSNGNKIKKRRVSEIATSSLSNPTKSKVLFNLVNYFKFKNVLELGTSLGISSSYLALANLKATVYSLEGDGTIMNYASEVHHKLGIHNVILKEGPFELSLKPTLDTMKQVDLAFVDGHHLMKPTLQYVKQILPYCHKDSILVIDDIYWSPEMTAAWEELKSMKQFSLSIDLFDIGLLFLNTDLSKEDFTYISYKLKPWKIGLFR